MLLKTNTFHIKNTKNNSNSDSDEDKNSKIDREKITYIFIAKCLVIRYLN